MNISSILGSAKKLGRNVAISAAVEAAKPKLIGQPLPKKIEADIQQSLPEGLRLTGTRVVSLDYSSGTLKLQVAFEIDPAEADLATLLG